MPAVFDQNYVKKLDGTNVKEGQKQAGSRRAAARGHSQLQEEQQLRSSGDGVVRLDRNLHQPGPAHQSLAAFEQAMENNDETHRAFDALCVCGAAWKAFRSPTAHRTSPSTFRRSRSWRNRSGVPIAGKDFKTGQTLMKTIVAPGLKARMLGLNGWFSTNILGNRDGEVLDDPDSFKTKEESKLGVLEHILQPQLYPELYGNVYHKVRINYYPPHGDNKEGWDNIDIFGWMGYPMQIKIDFLCRDSILAAPIVLDLALFMDLAQRAGMSGIQEWLSFYLKSPMAAPGLYPEHDLFIQQMKLKNTLRHLADEEQITHLGLEYYES